MIPWRRAWQPTQYSAWRIPCQSSLADYSPQGHKDSDATEATSHTCTCSKKCDSYTFLTKQFCSHLLRQRLLPVHFMCACCLRYHFFHYKRNQTYFHMLKSILFFCACPVYYLWLFLWSFFLYLSIFTSSCGNRSDCVDGKVSHFQFCETSI